MSFPKSPRRADRRSLIEALEFRRLLCSIPHSDQAPHIEELTFTGPAPESSAPANIVWTNRGSATNDSDRFNSVFGANAPTARGVIDAVIAHFQRMVGSFNYSDGSSNYNLSLSMASSGTSLGASASVTSTLNGKPKAGSVSMGRGNNGSGGGWYIDPTPNDHTEFLGSIVNAFSGNATPGGPASGLSDFYTVAAAEITHALGLFGHSTSLPGFRNLNTNTGIADNAEGGGIGTFYVFRGPSIKHLMTSNNGGPGGSSFNGAIHSAGPTTSGITFDGENYIGAQDIGNAVYENSRRYIPNLTFALMFRDAYNYSTVNPAQFGTFYALLDGATGTLHVRGGTGADAVHVAHDPVAGTFTVRVDPVADVPGTGALPGHGNLPAWESTYAAADVNAIVIATGDGNDTITIASTDATTPITINGGLGQDTVHLGEPNAPGGVSGILRRLTINDDFGVDTIVVNDQAATDNATWDVDGNILRRNGFELAQFGAFERVNLFLGAGDDVLNFANSMTSLRGTVDAGPGHDTINVNETSALELIVLPSPGADDVNVDADGGPSARVLLNTTGAFGTISVCNAGVVNVQAGGTRVITAAGLSISGDGVLNLNDNALIVDYDASAVSPLGSITGWLNAGYAGGAWNGFGGITSGSAGATSGRALGHAESAALFGSFPATFAGQSVDETAVLVRFTLTGDANLDRTVNIADFAILASAFNATGEWWNGNFNFDGQVNIGDFSLLASAFNTALPAGDAAASAMTGPARRPPTVAFGDRRIEPPLDEPERLVALI